MSVSQAGLSAAWCLLLRGVWGSPSDLPAPRKLSVGFQSVFLSDRHNCTELFAWVLSFCDRDSEKWGILTPEDLSHALSLPLGDTTIQSQLLHVGVRFQEHRSC